MLLSEGDPVAIISPSSQLRSSEHDLIRQAEDLLSHWGLRVVTLVNRGNHFYFAGPDADRASILRDTIADPNIKAIFCTRGGYGAARLWRHVRTCQDLGQKLLVGYSDATSLHAMAGSIWTNVRSVYGPNIATAQLHAGTMASRANTELLRKALFDPQYEVRAEVETLREGVASGELVGGCLSVIVTTLGTEFEIETAGRVLFLEDVGEQPYKVDRMLGHLRNAGKLEGVAGIVFGKMHRCKDQYNDLRHVICDVLSGTDFPVALGLESGHGETNIPIFLGAECTLSTREGTFWQGRP